HVDGRGAHAAARGRAGQTRQGLCLQHRWRSVRPRQLLQGCRGNGQSRRPSAQPQPRRRGAPCSDLLPRGKEHVAATEVRAGDIAAATKLTHTLTGDTLGLKDGGPVAPIDFPGPAYSLAITPKARGDEEKIASGLARLSEEDPTLQVERSEETKQLEIAGLGDVHLDETLLRLKR